MNNDQTAGGSFANNIEPGIVVNDASGETIGNVAEYNPGDDSFVLRGGWLFPENTRIPVNAIGDVGASGLYLKDTKDALQQQYGQGGSAGSAQATTGTVSPAMGTPSTQSMQGTDMEDAATVTTAGAAAAGGVTDRADATEMVSRADTERGRMATTAGDETGDVRVPLREEELVVGKRQEELGSVHLHKDVVEEQETIDVPLSQERVTVERVPAGDAIDQTSTDAFTERDIDVPVMGEEPVVEKRAVVTEEVRLHKDAVTEQQEVSDTVRKERVTVDGVDEGDGVDAAGIGGSDVAPRL